MKEDNLIALVTKYRLTLPGTRAGYDVLPWRSSHEVQGTIPSLDIICRMLCTNGVVAWFARGDDSTFWGHASNFVADPVEKGFVPRKKREKTERQKREEELLAML